MDEHNEPERFDEEPVGLRRVGKPKFWTAMAAYLTLAILAELTLNGPTVFEFRLRVLVWLLLGALAVKTIIHKMRDS